jgi:hypothetical protein
MDGGGGRRGAHRPFQWGGIGGTGTLTCEPPALALIVRKYENYGPVTEVDYSYDRQ